MIKEVCWNKKAVKSLNKTYDFIYKSSPKNATKFIDKVDALINILQAFPDIGRRSEKYKTVRQCRVDKYRKMFYRKEGSSLIIIIFQDDRMTPSKKRQY